MLTSKPPFYHGDILHQVRNLPPDPLEQRLAEFQLTNNVPPDVAALIMACLAKNPEQRPQSAGAVAEWIGLTLGTQRTGLLLGSLDEPGTAKSAPGHPLTRPAATLSPSDGERDGARGASNASLDPRFIGSQPNQGEPEEEQDAPVEAPARSKTALWVSVAVAAVVLAGIGGWLLLRNARQTETPSPSTPSTLSTVDAGFIQEVAALPAEQQIARFVARLKELNPGFDGKVEHKIENGKVVELSFSTEHVKDISPVRALSTLRKLTCDTKSATIRGILVDLSPLRGMQLTELMCSHNPIRDLAPLRGAPITSLECVSTSVADLSPLRASKLENLTIGGTPVSDLSPLRDLLLRILHCYRTRVADLKPLAGMKTLKQFSCYRTQVTDLSPLKALPLTRLYCDFVPARDIAILDSIKTLEEINRLPATEFWKQVEAGRIPSPEGIDSTQVASSAMAAVLPAPATLSSGQRWTNTLGMVFVSVPGTPSLFSIWETRVQDYEAFAKATNRNWEKPPFTQGPTHPAVIVSWDDAKAFCQWLTEKERGEGKLGASQSYRLPTDAEWSLAVGLPKESGATPDAKSGKIAGVYPWGNQWPPPKSAGNYDPSLAMDNFAETAPVGSFAANRYGLYDLGGNVMEWCEDYCNGRSGARVLRDGSWKYGDQDSLLSSCRQKHRPSDFRDDVIGFRCVLEGVSASLPAQPALSRATSSTVSAAPAKTIEPAPAKLPSGQRWTNTMGMVFTGVPGTPTLFSIWETRVQDYEAFTKATGRSWAKPKFIQGPTHPAVIVSWDDAKAFCQWLTAKERGEGKLGASQSYRLPTDAEWTLAVGLEKEIGATPAEKSHKIEGVYPWGTQWPPPNGAGNYAASLAVDSFEKTAPVGSFAANRYGIHDLSGNVMEWCEDEYRPGSGTRVLRGATWGSPLPNNLLSSTRFSNAPSLRGDGHGFRCVLAGQSFQ